MARYVRFAGLASIVIVEHDDEIDALLDHPELDRTYRPAGPPLNRLLLSTLRHILFRDGQALLSFRPRGDGERAAAQAAAAKRLDALAQQAPWSNDALAAMAAYVANGTNRDAALAALTYATAYPFLAADGREMPIPFEPKKFGDLFEQYQRLKFAHRRWKGLLGRLLGADRRAEQEILRMTGGDDYGLHAVGITLANSEIILENLRASFAVRLTGTATGAPFDWRKVRTAPAMLTRQNKTPLRFAGVSEEVPANALVLLKTRQALRPDSPAGFEFASKHWSYCPASRYMMAIFQRVYELAQRSRALS